MKLSVQHISPHPLLTPESAPDGAIRYGFEGGRVLHHDGQYHLFTTELPGEPFWVRTRIAHWASDDGTTWRRVSTLYESSADMTGQDPRAALWAPMPVFDSTDSRWNLFYVAYRSAPDTDEAFFRNHHGQIWRAVSTKSGPDGLDGPYRDEGVILSPDEDSGAWEGLQGTDSFFPFQTENGWLAFYGSARTEQIPIPYWRVGIVQAPRLSGPWLRDHKHSPISAEEIFIENPVVTTHPDGRYIAVYDSGTEEPYTVGVMSSIDGTEWTREERITIDPEDAPWIEGIRTPQGILFGEDGSGELFFTAWIKTPDRADAAGDEQWPIASFGRITLSW